MKSAPQASLGENDKTPALVAGQGVGKWPGLEEAASIECLLCAGQHSRNAQSRLLTHGLGRNLQAGSGRALGTGSGPPEVLLV